MQGNYLRNIERELQQIVDMLLLNGTLTECPGLVHGKMGIAIFFFHYAQFTGNDLFADYAMDLIGEMMHQLHINSPADYEKGIAGIGVGIEYLIKNGFLKVEDDICEDFDQRMIRAVMYDPWQDFSQYNGLTGYGRYWITRLSYQTSLLQARECLQRIIVLIEEALSRISITEQTDVYCFLIDLQSILGFESCFELLNQCRNKWNLQSSDIIRGFPGLGHAFVGNFIRSYLSSVYFNDKIQYDIDFDLERIPTLNIEVVPNSMGLVMGYAGEGLLRLTALNRKDISWVHLL